MKRIILYTLSAMACTTLSAQSIVENLSSSTAVVVRDPARQSSTEVDAAIYNPAGTAFLKDGLSFSVSGITNFGSTKANDATKSYKINENYVMPSVQVAYKTGKWSFSGSFASEGGFKRNYKNGAPSIEAMQGLYNESLANMGYSNSLQTLGLMCDIVSLLENTPDIGIHTKDELRLSQNSTKTHLYNHTIRIGAAYELSKNFSAYAGLKLSRVSWKAKPNFGMEVYNSTSQTATPFSDYFKNASANAENISDEELKSIVLETLQSNFNTYENVNKEMIDIFTSPLTYTENGWGITPVLGIDYKSQSFNIGMKYEFGNHVNISDGQDFTSPAIMSLGGNWQALRWLNVAVGGDMYFKSTGNPIFAFDDNLFWDASISATFTCSKSLKANVGWQIWKQSYYTEDFGYRHDIEVDNHPCYNKFSVGVRYAFSDKISADLGIAIMTNTSLTTCINSDFDLNVEALDINNYTGNSITYVTYKKNAPVQIALGLNYNL